jgi:hypothetical protein
VVTLGGTPTYTFANKNFGNNKPITASGFTLSGSAAANYVIVQPTGLSANITHFALTGSFTAADKIFDGTTNATILNRSLTGVFGGDLVSYVGGTATFDTAAVGSSKTVTAVGLSLTGADFANYTVNTTAITTANITRPASTTIDRRVFYNNASFFGTGGLNATNQLLNPVDAIDFTKTALLPGGVASVANYTNYSRGINGLIIDILNPANLAAIDASSFQFASWSAFPDATPNFQTITPLVNVSTISSGGQGGSDRIKLSFQDRAIENAWLRVTMIANLLTNGLLANDVFYFGNARFDVTPTAPEFGSQVAINVLDTNQVRARNGQNSGIVSNVFDVDRSGAVNVLDTNATRAGNGVSSLRFFNAPVSLQVARSASSATPRIVSPSFTKKSRTEATDDFFSQWISL